MKKSIKFFSVLLMVMLLVSFMASNVFATGSRAIIDDLNGKIDGASGDLDDSLMTKIGEIIKLIRNASVVLAVILFVIIGVKYMISSLDQKAELKKSIIPLVVGAIIVVSATSLASFIFSIMS